MLSAIIEDGGRVDSGEGVEVVGGVGLHPARVNGHVVA